jgi:hypothetical protein
LKRNRNPWVYLAMDKYSDLAPWFLGGLLIAAVAVAMTLSANNRTAPKTLPASSASIAKMLPAASAMSSPAPLAAELAPAPLAAGPLAAEPLAPAAPPATAMQPVTAADQIWECTINGQRTFSNNPCGEKSSLRKIGPINTMDPTPVLRYSRPYQPETGYAPAYAQEYDNSGTQEHADDSYQALVGVPYLAHRRGERMHRPYQHTHGPAPRRN